MDYMNTSPRTSTLPKIGSHNPSSPSSRAPISHEDWSNRVAQEFVKSLNWNALK